MGQSTHRPDSRGIATQPTADARTMHEYTDAENTGLPVVPDLTGRTDRETQVSESVWSHYTEGLPRARRADDD